MPHTSRTIQPHFTTTFFFLYTLIDKLYIHLPLFTVLPLFYSAFFYSYVYAHMFSVDMNIKTSLKYLCSGTDVSLLLLVLCVEVKKTTGRDSGTQVFSSHG